MCKENNKSFVQTNTNTGKGGIDPGDQGVKNIKDFNKGSRTDIATMSKAERKAAAEMVHDLWKLEQIEVEERDEKLKALGYWINEKGKLKRL